MLDPPFFFNKPADASPLAGRTTPGEPRSCRWPRSRRRSWGVGRCARGVPGPGPFPTGRQLSASSESTFQRTPKSRATGTISRGTWPMPFACKKGRRACSLFGAQRLREVRSGRCSDPVHLAPRFDDWVYVDDRQLRWPPSGGRLEPPQPQEHVRAVNVQMKPTDTVVA